MKNTKTYVCLVDSYRRLSRQRNTSGRYLVGAKNEDEAKKLLQGVIKFGSIQVYYEVPENPSGSDKHMNYREIVKVNLFVENGKYKYEHPRTATDKLN